MKDKVRALFADENFRGAVWIFFAAVLVGYFGIMFIMRIALGDGGAGIFDSIIAAIFALVVGVIAARKRYNDDL